MVPNMNKPLYVLISKAIQNLKNIYYAGRMGDLKIVPKLGQISDFKIKIYPRNNFQNCKYDH